MSAGENIKPSLPQIIESPTCTKMEVVSDLSGFYYHIAQTTEAT